ncbi:hypothetical protein CPB86DRAFT_827417 [Serendipita vermifera]|nr:hypothetical protein CPB86DRAFT_827417 [Serendipita vermifera]
MANFNVLPLELIAEIVQLALVVDISHLPTIGLDASYFFPHVTNMEVATTTSCAESDDSIRAVISSSRHRPSRPSFPHKTHIRPPFGLCVIAESLRLVNRTFNAICVPLLYKYVNLLARSDDIEKFQATSQSIFIPYSYHIHTLYVYIDSSVFYLTHKTEKYTAGILGVCTELVMLGLYYYYSAHQPMISQEVVSLAEKGKLVHLGIYSQNVLEGRTHGQGNQFAIGKLIDTLAASPQARDSIKTLELAVESISMETFITIHTKFSALRSLTFRRALDILLKSPSEVEQGRLWSPHRGLQRLQLTRCDLGSYVRIPFLLRLFPGLRELLVTGGSYRRNRRWNHGPIIHHQTQNILELLHIESMQEMEVRELVGLRANTLIMANMGLKKALNIFKGDINSFPGLKILRLELELDDVRANDISQWEDLSEICKGRTIELRADAVSDFGPKRELQ